jgi:type 1 glutamine amidotransferase
MLRTSPLILASCLLLGALACSETHDARPGAQHDAGEGGRPSSATGGTAGSASPALSGSGGERHEGGSDGGPLAGGGGGGGGRSGLAGATAGDNAGGTGNPSAGMGGSAAADRISLLVFSRTLGYRHDSIPAGVQALTKLAADRGWSLLATEDATKFSDPGLAAYNAVVFLSTTGDVLDDAQQSAFERFIRSGRAFIGIHSASDTEYDWPWYGGLVGAYFREHPAVQSAEITVEDTTNPATAGLPKPWRRTDEWYAFKSNPRANVHVLLSLDESSFAAGSANMNGDHPIAWCHEYDGGRAFYTALGHTSESFADPAFMAHLAGAVTWAVAP